MIDHNALEKVTAFELVCAAPPSGTMPVRIPGWALMYVLGTPRQHILTTVTRERQPRVSGNAEAYVFEDVQFARVLRNRLGIVEPTVVKHWRLGLWRQSSTPGVAVTPFLLIGPLYSRANDDARLHYRGWTQTVSVDGLTSDYAIVEPRTIFSWHAGHRVDTLEGQCWRRHMEWSCHVHDWLKGLLEREEVNRNLKDAESEPRALYLRENTTDGYLLCIQATKGTICRMDGRATDTAGQYLWPADIERPDLKQSLDMLREYIELPSSDHDIRDRERYAIESI